MTRRASAAQGTPVPEGPVGGFLRDVGLEPEQADVLGDAVTFLVVLAAAYLVGRLFVLPTLTKLMDRRDLDAHARKPLRKLTMALVLFGGISVAFGAAGYGSFLTSLATVGAAATLAIGFALQDVLKNLVAGLFIFTDRPFRIGDWIEWDDYEGVVQDISLRVTRVRTFDNELLTVPNSTLTDGVIKNPVANERLRMKVDYGIGYDDDIETATDIIIEEAEAHDEILEHPEPTVRLTELGDSDVGLQARVWIDDPSRSDYVRIRGDFVTAVKQRFDEAGIDIPYPHQVLQGGIDVSQRSVPAEAAED